MKARMVEADKNDVPIHRRGQAEDPSTINDDDNSVVPSSSLRCGTPSPWSRRPPDLVRCVICWHCAVE
jgi:hypothetical protein